MTSEETLVAEAAADLLRLNLSVSSVAQIVVETDTAALTLPAVVVSARFEDEEQGSSLPKRYTLTTELRSVDNSADAAAIDATFRAIDNAFNTAPATWPARLTTVFAQLYIESQTGSAYEPGDTQTRRRSYLVFAKLLTTTDRTVSVPFLAPGAIMVRAADGATTSYGTIALARAAAISGQSIHVGQGTYSNLSDLLKDGVDWYFAHGVTLIGSADGSGLFSDGGTAKTCNVYGHAVIQGAASSTQHAGLIEIGGASVVNIECESLTSTGDDSGVPLHVDNAAAQVRVLVRGGIYNSFYDCIILNAGQVVVEADEIISTGNAPGREGEALELGPSGSYAIRARKLQSNFDTIEMAGTGGVTAIIEAGEVNSGLLSGIYPAAVLLASGNPTLHLRAMTISGGTYNDGVKVSAGAAFLNGATIATGAAKKDLVQTAGTLLVNGVRYDADKTTGTITSGR